MILFCHLLSLLVLSQPVRKPVYVVVTNEIAVSNRIVPSTIDRDNKTVVAYDTMTVYTLPCKNDRSAIRLVRVGKKKIIKSASFFEGIKPTDCTWISRHIGLIASTAERSPLIGPVYMVEKKEKQIILTQVVFDIAQEERIKDW
ncbi:hypothetical protein [Arsenicibacter rosenii]|uniref:Uncharacterized protein n=1 Tax=Arsenicibacter rosenii TaxID=1750698 RepID=A0A1S2VPA9_9BACT|nr:hypothetical protein [Arsenicibacter rosenii]OIN60589.1 hypothetical protein BLX24_00220 [Arsenicibacter rosenii]